MAEVVRQDRLLLSLHKHNVSPLNDLNYSLVEVSELRKRNSSLIIGIYSYGACPELRGRVL